MLCATQVDLTSTVNEVGGAVVEAGHTMAKAMHLEKEPSAEDIRQHKLRKLSSSSGRKGVYETALYDFHENVESRVRKQGPLGYPLASIGPRRPSGQGRPKPVLWVCAQRA